MADPTRADDPVDAPPSAIGAQLILGLLRGGGELPSLLSLFEQSPLTAEQRTVVELLETIRHGGGDDDDEDDEDDDGDRPSRARRRGRAGAAAREARAESPIAPPYYEAPEPDDRSGDPVGRERDAITIGAGELARMRRELADLREVNDTLAAALGACRACWGGQPGCPVCGGRGHAGDAAPEPALFDALIVPAVRRMRARANRSPTTEASP